MLAMGMPKLVTAYTDVCFQSTKVAIADVWFQFLSGLDQQCCLIVSWCCLGEGALIISCFGVKN
jgi:hypothetical protein